VNTQGVRTRFWMARQVLSRRYHHAERQSPLHFGGAYQRNYNYHQRSDNGGVSITSPRTNSVREVAGVLWTSSATNPLALPDHVGSRPLRPFSVSYGPQIAYTRSGPTLILNPPLNTRLTRAPSLTTTSTGVILAHKAVLHIDLWPRLDARNAADGKVGKQIELVDGAGQQLDLKLT